MNSIIFEEKEKKFTKFYQSNFDFHNSALRVFENLLQALLIDKVEIDSTSSRIKNCDECVQKFKDKYLSDLEKVEQDYNIQDSITDLLGIRIVCLYTSDFSKIKELLEENFIKIDITDKTAQIESTENQFGYKGLHLDLKLNQSRSSLPEYSKFGDLRFELQIRTIVQDAWSVLDHKIKYKKTIPHELKRRINRLAALFEVVDEEFLSIKNAIKEEVAKVQAQGPLEHAPETEKLNVFTFLKIVKGYFSQYQFDENKADNFVEEILIMKRDYLTLTFYTAIARNIEIVESYSREHYMNPYTFIRHILYISDKSTFSNMLYTAQRMSFDKWLDKATPIIATDYLL